MTDKPPSTSVRMESSPCPLGCVDGDVLLFTGRDRITKREGEFCVVQCRQCGLVRTDPRPDAATMGHFYPDEYPPYQGAGPAPVPRKSALPAFVSRLLQKQAARSRALPDVEPGRLLEIGCASGDFLEQAASQGWDVCGLEFSPFAAERARERGFHVYGGSLEDAALPEASYDLIVGWMVLEHLHEPVAALKKLRSAVRPGGHLVISVPDFSCAGQQLFRDTWQALQVPAHLFHYTPSTARKVLEASGWIVDEVTHQRNLSSWMVSSAWWLEDKGLPARVTSTLERFPRWGVAARLPFYPIATLAAAAGQTGRMNITARAAPTPQR